MIICMCLYIFHHELVVYIYIYKLYLVGGLGREFYDFPYIGNFIIPTDSYFSEGLKPPSRYTYMVIYVCMCLCMYICIYNDESTLGYDGLCFKYESWDLTDG